MEFRARFYYHVSGVAVALHGAGGCCVPEVTVAQADGRGIQLRPARKKVDGEAQTRTGITRMSQKQEDSARWKGQEKAVVGPQWYAQSNSARLVRLGHGNWSGGRKLTEKSE
jgi:hypothetical protein